MNPRPPLTPLRTPSSAPRSSPLTQPFIPPPCPPAQPIKRFYREKHDCCLVLSDDDDPINQVGA